MSRRPRQDGAGLVDTTWRDDLRLVALGAVPLVVILWLVFAPPAARRPVDDQPLGQVVSLLGQVQGRSAGELVWNQLQRQDPVYRGQRVFAAEEAEAVIELGDGSRLVVEESSLVVLQAPAREAAGGRGARVDLLRGGVAGQGVGDEITVASGPSTTRLAAGTEATVRRGADHDLVVEVRRGQADLKLKSGRRVTVQERQRGRVDRGGRTASTEHLLIELTRPGPRQRAYITEERGRVEFAWRGARAPYEFELARDAAFHKIQVRRPASRPATVVELPEGIYFWRVRSEDAASEVRRLAVVRERPPVCRQPQPDQLVLWQPGPGVFLAWTEVPDAAAYHLEIRDEQERLVATRRTGRTNWRLLDKLPEGRYCLRVRVDDPQRPQAPWSSERCFRLIHKAVPRPPRLFDPRVEPLPDAEDDRDQEPEQGSWLESLFIGTAHAAPARRGIMLRWERVPGVSAYQLEIAEDLAFEKLVLRKLVQENYFPWQRLTQRTYFWRVRSIDAEGRPGKFSPPRIIGPVVAPPQPLAPRDGMRLRWGDEPPRIAMRWQRQPLLRDTVLEIYPAEEPHRRLLRRSLGRATSFAWSPPKPGSYHWQLRGVDLNGRPTARGAPRRLVVVLEAPRPRQPPAGNKIALARARQGIELRWSRRPARRYQVRLEPPKTGPAAAAAITKTVTADRLRLVLENPGDYRWRVRCLQPASPWSKPVSFTVEPPPPPEPPPAAPRLLSPAPGRRLVIRQATADVELSWQPVAGAVAYRVELSGPGEPRRDRSVEPRWKAAELPPGAYRWQVRAVDARGVQGEPAQADFVVVMRPPLPAPTLQDPAPGAELVLPAGRPVELSWGGVEQADNYQVELLPPGQQATRLRRQVAEPRLPLEPPLEGTWRWRVRAREADDTPGSWSAERSFTYAVYRPPLTERALFVGLHLDLVYNLGEITTAQPALEIGYRLPFWQRRLGLTLQVGWYTASASVASEGGGQQASARLHLVPLELLTLAATRLGALHAYLGCGPRLGISRVTIDPAGLAVNHLHWGVVGLVGVEGRLGPGWWFGELRYSWMSAREELVQLTPGGIMVGAGYRLGLW